MDGWCDRHARAQAVVGILSRFKHDLHRHALHHLDVIARRILGWKQAELRAGRRREAVDAPFELAIQPVNADRDRLPRLHPSELRFLEVGRDPDVFQRHERKEWLSWLHDLTDFDRLATDDARGWSFDLCTMLIELG